MTSGNVNSRHAGGPTDSLVRILLIATAVIWLLALGSAVAAIVALVDLGRGPQGSGGGSGTPWLLYTVIVVSALVIIAAVPLLLKARRTALDGSAPPQTRRVEDHRGAAAEPARGIETHTGKLRMFGPPSAPVTGRPGFVSAAAPNRLDPGFPAAGVDQVYLRFGLSVACALGAAATAIGAATYLMAVDSDTMAWISYGVAGVVTLGSIALPWYYLRELNALLARR